MKTPREPNPLSGLKVPSVEELVAEVMQHLGLATINLADAGEREHFRRFLVSAISRTIRWRLQRALQQATEKAITHTLALMGDPEYQAKRTLRRKHALEARRERDADRERERQVERQAREQQRKRLVQ